MKLLVTGGTVFVSKFVAQYFSQKGYDVYVLNRNTRTQLDGVTLIEADRSDLRGKLKNFEFDAVIDVTAYTAENINNLLDGLGRFGEYVMISSSAVYPETLKIPFKESDECGKNCFWGIYGTNKIAAEQALISRVPDAYIIRPPYLYGEYNNVYREAFVFDCADRCVPFYLPKDGDMLLQFYHVEDLCKFIEMLLGKKPEQKIYNVGNKPVTIKEWVELCYKATGRTVEFINVYEDIEQRKYFPFYDYGYVLDVARQDELMPCSIALEAGLTRAYQWYKDHRSEVNAKDYLAFIANNFIK